LGVFRRAKELRAILPSHPLIDDQRWIGETACHIFSKSWQGDEKESCVDDPMDEIAGKLVYSVTWYDLHRTESVMTADARCPAHLNRQIGFVIAAIPGTNQAFILMDDAFHVVTYAPDMSACPPPPGNLDRIMDGIMPMWRFHFAGDDQYCHPRPSSCIPWIGQQREKANVRPDEEGVAEFLGYLAQNPVAAQFLRSMGSNFV
jgi:hypothetical protein